MPLPFRLPWISNPDAAVLTRASGLQPHQLDGLFSRKLIPSVNIKIIYKALTLESSWKERGRAYNPRDRGRFLYLVPSPKPDQVGVPWHPGQRNK